MGNFRLEPFAITPFARRGRRLDGLTMRTRSRWSAMLAHRLAAVVALSGRARAETLRPAKTQGCGRYLISCSPLLRFGGDHYSEVCGGHDSCWRWSGIASGG